MSNSTIPTKAIFSALNRLHTSARGRHFTTSAGTWKNQRMKGGYLLAIEEVQEEIRKLSRESYDSL